MASIFPTKRDVYLEIADRYEKYIMLGVLKPGDKLPSVRVAASELRVNPNTVQRAYTLLEEKGLIRSMPKKGAFVIFGQARDKASEDFDALRTLLRSLKDEGASKKQILSVIEEVYEND